MEATMERRCSDSDTDVGPAAVFPGQMLCS